MFVIPNSSAMDATAYGGGPSTFVSQIATGSPEKIAQLVEQRLKQAEEFLKLIQQAQSAVQTLNKAWSGQAGETAVKKFTDTLESFEKIVKVIEATSQMLGVSGTLVKAAQTAYTTVVSAVNPVVASLASNWWTYWAAVSLSTSASAALKAFITGIEALLNALGAGQLAQEIMALVKIIEDVEKLIHSGSHGTTVPPAGTYTQPNSTGTQNQLHAPPQIASTTGQQVAANGGADPTAASTLNQYAHTDTSAHGDGVYPAGSTAGTTGTTGANGANGQTPWVQHAYPGLDQQAQQQGQFPSTQYPSTQYPNTQYPNTQIPNMQYPSTQYPNTSNGTNTYLGQGQTPGSMISDPSGFVAVDPSQQGPSGALTPQQPVASAPVTPPAAPAPSAPATPPGDITVTTTYDGVSTTVTMPVGTQTDVTLVDPTNGSTVTEHIMASASK